MSRSLLFKNSFKSLFQFCVRNVIVWRFENKSKYKRNVLSLSLDNFIKLDEGFVHNECFFHLLKRESFLVSVENFCHEDVINVVNLNKIEEKHVNKVLEESGLFTKVFIFEHLNYHVVEVVKVLLYAEKVLRFQLLDVAWYFRSSLGQQTCF